MGRSNRKGAGWSKAMALWLILGSLNHANSLGRGYPAIIGSVQTLDQAIKSSPRRDKPDQVTDLRVESIGLTRKLNHTEWNYEQNEKTPFFIVQLNWTAAGHQKLDKDSAAAFNFVEIRASLREGEMLSDFGNCRLVEGVRTESVAAGHEQKARFKLPADLVNSTLRSSGDDHWTDVYFALVTVNAEKRKSAEMSNVARGRLTFVSPGKEPDQLRGQFIILVSGVLALFGMGFGIVLIISNLVFMCKKKKRVFQVDRECKVYVISV